MTKRLMWEEQTGHEHWGEVPLRETEAHMRMYFTRKRTRRSERGKQILNDGKE